MIRLIDVAKLYRQGENEIIALAGITLDIQQGEFVVVMGPSGSGKSTLLHLIGGLDRPTHGDVLIAGRLISQLPDDEITLFRRTQVGFIFQFFNLMPTLTAVENVTLPLILDGWSRPDANRKGEALVERVGLAARRDHLPEELSGGEIQRLAVARALIFDPPILLGDEPTGNLDSKTGEAILSLIQDANRRQGCTVVMVTHNVQTAGYGDRIIRLKDGVIEENRSL
jgi:putative ABC transport system ATP-binding protein